MASTSPYPNVTVVEHPLVQHKLTILRDTKTGSKQFRELVKELAMLEAYEATRGFQLAETTVTTPITETMSYVLAGKKVAVIPILRAGLGMVDGILELIPAARVGHIGLYRDPQTLKPVEYYCKLPEDIAERDVLIVDPMLATGGSASAAVEFLQGARRAQHQPPRAHRGTRRHRRGRQRVRRHPHLLLLDRRPPQRPRLHRPWSRRRRRPAVRHQVGERSPYAASKLGRVLHVHRRAGLRRSTCLRRATGAILVKDKRILATGYNGAAKGLAHCEQDGMPARAAPHSQRHATTSCAAASMPSRTP